MGARVEDLNIANSTQYSLLSSLPFFVPPPPLLPPPHSSSLSASNSLLGAEGDLSILCQAYDEVGAPSLTLLPPRHCMYGVADDVEPPPVEDEEAGKDSSSEEDGGEVDPREAAKRRAQREQRKEAADKQQEAAEALGEAHGVSIVVAKKFLARYGGDEEKASAALEKINDQKYKVADDQDELGM